MRAVRLVSTSPETDLSIELKPGVNKIGRQRVDNHIVLVGPEISRFHTEIDVLDDGIKIRDLGSSNGTFVNNVRVKESGVKAGDMVAFSEQFSFQLVIDTDPAARAPASMTLPPSMDDPLPDSSIASGDGPQNIEPGAIPTSLKRRSQQLEQVPRDPAVPVMPVPASTNPVLPQTPSPTPVTPEPPSPKLPGPAPVIPQPVVPHPSAHQPTPIVPQPSSTPQPVVPLPPQPVVPQPIGARPSSPPYQEPPTSPAASPPPQEPRPEVTFDTGLPPAAKKPAFIEDDKLMASISMAVELRPSEAEQAEMAVLERERRQLAVLYQVSKRCMSVESLGELDRLLINVLERIVAFERGFITYQLPTGDWKLVMSPKGDRWERRVVRKLLQTALKNKTPLTVADSRRDGSLGSPEHGQTDARLLLPLSSRAAPVGTVFLISNRADSFDDYTVDFLSLFADIAALAIHNSARMEGH